MSSPAVSPEHRANIERSAAALARFINPPSKHTLASLVDGVEELGEAHIALAVAHVQSGASLGVKPAPLRTIRHTHHRLARIIATGKADMAEAAMLCNYSPARVSILLGDPAFQELVEHYRAKVEESWADFVTASHGLSLDALQEIQARLDESPESISTGQLLEIVKTTADRSGHGPVARSVNLNVNTEVAARLQAADARVKTLRASYAEVVDVPPTE